MVVQHLPRTGTTVEQPTGGHMADVDMSDVGPPTNNNPTSNPEETLKLPYDLDARTRIPEGEFTKDIPPPSRGEFTKPASKSTPTQDGQPRTSSVPAGTGNQGDDDDNKESDDEYEGGGDARPGEGAGHHAGDLGGQIRGAGHGPHQKREGHQIMMKVLPTWAASAWSPQATTPSQTLWRFLVSKVLTLLSHHTLLRGASICEITLPDIFLYRLASTLSVNPENQPVVMVIAARNSKTSKDARLQQSYIARHLEAEFCAVGENGLWLHFILDQIGQFTGVDFLLPLDTTERERWYKKHLFFARNDKEQKELSTASHQRWTRQMWTTNKVFRKQNVHAARVGGAQELAIEGTPRAEIAELAHWALDKMTRA
ncbi:unnamed protein product [Closterium sp. NIES-53]